MNAQKVEIDYIVRVHDEDDGHLWAEVLDLPGCFASGETLDELLEAVREAISLYVGGDSGAARVSEVGATASLRVDEIRVKMPT